MKISNSENQIPIHAIVAMCDTNRGIGLNRGLPWHIPSDTIYYLTVHTRTKDKLKKNAVIVGRLTFEDVLKYTQEEPNLIYIVISNTITKEDLKLENKINPINVFVCKSYSDAVNLVNDKLTDRVENIFVLGGTQIYKSAFEYKKFDRLYLTHIYKEYKCDTFLEPENFLDWFEKIENFNDFSVEGFDIDKLMTDPTSNVEYRFLVYRRKF